MSDSVKKVSINRIIGNVIGNLGLSTTNNIKDDFARWACEAENKIGSTNSYKKFECELVIRNKKASLPDNFVYLNALKHGNKIIPITKRSFTMFHKGTSVNSIDENSKYNNNQLIVNTPGVPLVISVVFSGAFIVGDVIVLTVTSNNCGNVNSNTFNYIVQAGDSLTSIAQNVANLINAIHQLGYSATAGNEQIFIEGKSPDVNFTVTTFTDSINGHITQSIYQNRIPPKNSTENQGENCDVNVNTQSNNLANGHVNKLNTGINADGNPLSYDIFGSDVGESVFSIDNGCINFNALDNTRIGISYMGIELDEEGWPLIAESHEDAVTHYLMYMYKSIEYYKGKLPHHVYKELQTRWFDLCGQARGDDELPNSEELKYLSNMWMQLVPLPSKENY